MRALLFVISFTTGVTLMLISGYVPRGAAARDGAGLSSPTLSERGPIRPRAGRIWSPGLSDAQPDRFETHPPPVIEVDTGGDESKPSTTPQSSASTADEAEPLVPDRASEAPDEGDAEPSAVAPAEALTSPTLATTTDENSPELPAEEPAADPSPAPSTPPPVADAGPDRVVWNGWDELTLDGRGSHGDDLLYEWRQVSGPTVLTLADPYAPRTKASGLVLGPGAGWLPLLYQFELTVIDAAGREASDTVEFVAIAAPELTVQPAATRVFENRDGYWLGHYTARVVAMTDMALFEVSAPTQLVFTHVGTVDVEVATVATGETNAYEIVIYRTADETTSQTEFLVDTDEEIPGVLRLSVSWEGR